MKNLSPLITGSLFLMAFSVSCTKSAVPDDCIFPSPPGSFEISEASRKRHPYFDADTIVFRNVSGVSMSYALSGEADLEESTSLCLFPCPENPDEFRFINYKALGEVGKLEEVRPNEPNSFFSARAFYFSSFPSVTFENGQYVNQGDYFAILPQNQFRPDTSTIFVNTDLPNLTPLPEFVDTINGIPVIAYVPSGIRFPIGADTDASSFTFHDELTVGGRTFRSVYSSFADDNNTIPLTFNESIGIISFRDEDGIEWFWERSF